MPTYIRSSASNSSPQCNKIRFSSTIKLCTKRSFLFEAMFPQIYANNFLRMLVFELRGSGSATRKLTHAASQHIGFTQVLHWRLENFLLVFMKYNEIFDICECYWRWCEIKYDSGVLHSGFSAAPFRDFRHIRFCTCCSRMDIDRIGMPRIFATFLGGYSLSGISCSCTPVFAGHPTDRHRHGQTHPIVDTFMV